MSLVKDESPMKMRAALNHLIVDETEAITGYDDVLAYDSLAPEDRKVLEEIRNDEIDHIKKLSELYAKFATGAIEEDVRNSLFGDKGLQDFSAKGSFGSLLELKSFYAGSSLRLEGDKVIVTTRDGAELVYSRMGDGKLVFIRGKN